MKLSLQLFAVAALSLISACGRPALAQTPPGGHASHHPTPGAAPMPAGGDPAASAPPGAAPMTGGNQAASAGAGMSGGPPGAAPGPGMGGGMEAGMGEMMKQMGAPPPKELYPSLMALPDEVTPEQRAGIEQLAQERMKAGTALMSSGLEKLSDSTSDEDYAAMQQATAQMREGLAQFEAGIAARRVLSEGKLPRNLALDWFKREMNLASPIRSQEPSTVLGVPVFHLFTMALLIAFALAMVAMYFFKMRRAAALFGRLGPDANPPPGSSPQLAGAPGSSAPTSSPAEKSAAPDPPSGGASSVPVPGGGTAKAADKPPVAGGSPPASPATTPAVSDGGDDAKIADRAGELWKARGAPIGSPKVDWLQAEEELAKPADKPPAPPAAGGTPKSPSPPPAVSEAT